METKLSSSSEGLSNPSRVPPLQEAPLLPLSNPSSVFDSKRYNFPFQCSSYEQKKKKKGNDPVFPRRLRSKKKGISQNQKENENHFNERIGMALKPFFGMERKRACKNIFDAFINEYNLPYDRVSLRKFQDNLKILEDSLKEIRKDPHDPEKERLISELISQRFKTFLRLVKKYSQSKKDLLAESVPQKNPNKKLIPQLRQKRNLTEHLKFSDQEDPQQSDLESPAKMNEHANTGQKIREILKEKPFHPKKKRPQFFGEDYLEGNPQTPQIKGLYISLEQINKLREFYSIKTKNTVEKSKNGEGISLVKTENVRNSLEKISHSDNFQESNVAQEQNMFCFEKNENLNLTPKYDSLFQVNQKEKSPLNSCFFKEEAINNTDQTKIANFGLNFSFQNKSLNHSPSLKMDKRSESSCSFLKEKPNLKKERKSKGFKKPTKKEERARFEQMQYQLGLN